MHENQGSSVIYYAHYTEDGVNKTGLTVTITVYEVIRDGTKTEIVSDGACTEIGDGLYRYLLASTSVDAAAEYVAVFHTATDTVDAQDIPAIWVIDRAGTEKLDDGVTLADDAITSAKFDESTAFPVKSADTGATALARTGADADTLETISDQIDLIDASGIADAVWDELLAGHMIAGSAGMVLLDSGTSLSSILLLLSTSPSVLQHRCMNNDDLICRKSADFAASFIYLGDLSGVTDLYFTVKPQTKVNSYLDSQATIQIQEGVGLLYINGGVAGVPANGSITITDAINGHLTINLDAVETAKLTANTNYRYDIKADHNIIAEGNFYIQSAVTLTV